jgi:hypothetical protein
MRVVGIEDGEKVNDELEEIDEVEEGIDIEYIDVYEDKDEGDIE